MSARRVPPLPAVLLTAGLLLTGCAAPTYLPVAVENCGVDVEFTSPPQRVVTIGSTATETLLALGLSDRIVGTALADGAVPERWAADADGLVVLAEGMPAADTVLATDPDLVLAGTEAAFTADAVGERDELAEAGVATYVLPAACAATLDVDGAAHLLGDVADIFGVDATALIDEQRRVFDEVRPLEDAPTAFWWPAGTVALVPGTPADPAPIGASARLLLATAGLTDVTSGVERLDWAAVAAADPDVIVLVDATWDPAVAKIAYLRTFPLTADLTAVRAERFVVLPFAATEAGPRLAEAASSLVDQVRRLRLP